MSLDRSFILDDILQHSWRVRRLTLIERITAFKAIAEEATTPGHREKLLELAQKLETGEVSLALLLSALWVGFRRAEHREDGIKQVLYNWRVYHAVLGTRERDLVFLPARPTSAMTEYLEKHWPRTRNFYVNCTMGLSERIRAIKALAEITINTEDRQLALHIADIVEKYGYSEVVQQVRLLDAFVTTMGNRPHGSFPELPWYVSLLQATKGVAAA